MTAGSVRARLVVVASCAALAGCAGAVPGNLQGCAGITHVEARFGDDGRARHVEVCQGKAGESFEIEADVNAGRLSWKGKGVLAFDGQKVRGEVERAVAAELGESVGPGGSVTIVDAIMAGVKAALGVP